MTSKFGSFHIDQTHMGKSELSRHEEQENDSQQNWNVSREGGTSHSVGTKNELRESRVRITKDWKITINWFTT